MTLVCINIIGILSVLFSWQERRLEGIITSNQLRVSAAQILNVTHTARAVSNGERLRSFMDQYRPSFELLSEMSDYELIEYIRKQMSTNRER